jgi:hypothetical protein
LDGPAIPTPLAVNRPILISLRPNHSGGILLMICGSVSTGELAAFEARSTRLASRLRYICCRTVKYADKLTKATASPTATAASRVTRAWRLRRCSLSCHQSCVRAAVATTPRVPLPFSLAPG